MKEKQRRYLFEGICLLLGFCLWTVLVRNADVQAAGPDGSLIGFAALNVWFHQMTGVHMLLYTVTDWLGLVPVLICLCFGGIGLCQLIKRRSLLKVDPDILLLGIYYLLVIFCYLFFETVPINYRPILINGHLEASYPSSTTLLVLSVMPTTLQLQIGRRVASKEIRQAANMLIVLFSAFMVIGRLVSGVHWATDIIGAVLLSAGLFMLYRSAVARSDKKKAGRFEGD